MEGSNEEKPTTHFFLFRRWIFESLSSRSFFKMSIFGPVGKDDLNFVFKSFGSIEFSNDPVLLTF